MAKPMKDFREQFQEVFGTEDPELSLSTINEINHLLFNRLRDYDREYTDYQTIKKEEK